ncbi:MAG: hypothetical protein P8I97_13155 [Verrucomicrobiales bacterium]|nr:hypothetical protein [Verrucomicrobiales bacterium]
MKFLKPIITFIFAFGLFTSSLMAEIVWTGANGADIFDEANWDLSNSLVDIIDPNVSIDDDVIIANATVEIPQLTGQQRFQVGSGFTITVDDSEIRLTGGSNDGIGGADGSKLPAGPEGPILNIKNGSSVEIFFIVNGVQMNIDETSSVIFGGGGNPVNNSVIDMQNGSTVIFKNETVDAFNSEHIQKVFVDGDPAEEGVNMLIETGVDGFTTITAENDPVIPDDILVSFESDMDSVQVGETVNLSWVVGENTLSLSLDDGTSLKMVDFDPEDLDGNLDVVLTETTTFTLKGINESGTEEEFSLKVLVKTGQVSGITWTGADGTDIFEESNWDLTNSDVEIIDPNVSIEDDVFITNSTVEIPQVSAQQRFQVASGYTITVDNSTIRLTGGSNDGIGGPPGFRLPGGPEGPTMNIINGSSYESYFIVNGVQMNVDATSSATFGGGGNPVNISAINLESGSSLTFLRETIDAFNTEHLSKLTIGGVQAEEGVNYTIESDGAEGCVITTISDDPLRITNISRDIEGNIVIEWNGKPGTFYAVDFSFTLEEGSWEELIDSVTDEAADDTFAPESKVIFYKVREQE